MRLVVSSYLVVMQSCCLLTLGSESVGFPGPVIFIMNDSSAVVVVLLYCTVQYKNSTTTVVLCVRS